MKHRLPSVAVAVVALCALATGARGGAPEHGAPAAVIETRGAIPRATFETWVARGPQYLLSQVVPVAVTREKHFLGFKLSQWFPGHPDVAQGAVRLGDVVQRVNGRSVERPDQFLYVWKQLPGASSVLIEGARDGSALKATLIVIDEPAAPPRDSPASEPTPGTP